MPTQSTTPNKRPALVYARVSRQDQRPEMQVEECRRLIEARGWTVSEIYLDHGVSGSKDKRRELDRLRADLRRGRHGAGVVVCCWRTDRLFRSLKNMVATIDEFAALGVEFCSATEPMDTTTPQGKLLLHLVSAFGEFERNIIIERTRAGLDAARRRGVKIGRPRVHVPIVKARAMMASGMSLRATARKLKIGAATLFRALKAAETSPQEDAA